MESHLTGRPKPATVLVPYGRDLVSFETQFFQRVARELAFYAAAVTGLGIYYGNKLLGLVVDQAFDKFRRQ